MSANIKVSKDGTRASAPTSLFGGSNKIMLTLLEINPS